jgi:hypothetical protein
LHISEALSDARTSDEGLVMVDIVTLKKDIFNLELLMLLLCVLCGVIYQISVKMMYSMFINAEKYDEIGVLMSEYIYFMACCFMVNVIFYIYGWSRLLSLSKNLRYKV